MRYVSKHAALAAVFALALVFAAAKASSTLINFTQTSVAHVTVH